MLQNEDILCTKSQKPARTAGFSFSERSFPMTHLTKILFHINNEAIRSLLKTTYPEIANATIREVTTDDGQQVVEFLPQPGRKG